MCLGGAVSPSDWTKQRRAKRCPWYLRKIFADAKRIPCSLPLSLGKLRGLYLVYRENPAIAPKRPAPSVL